MLISVIDHLGNKTSLPGRGNDFSGKGTADIADQQGRVQFLGDIALQALESAGISKEELDWLVPHQANISIIQATAKRLDLPMEKVIVTVQAHGNTSAASVPLALDEAVRDGRIQRGDVLLLEAFGGGFTWGSLYLKWAYDGKENNN